MIHTRQLTSSLAVRDGGDGRTLVGPLLPWGVPARVVDQGRLVTETFTRGALAGNDPARVPLTATHPRDAGTLPIGRTLTIEDRSDAAWGESEDAEGEERGRGQRQPVLHRRCRRFVDDQDVPGQRRRVCA